MNFSAVFYTTAAVGHAQSSTPSENSGKCIISDTAQRKAPEER